jgi:c-di-GMP-binding flagellar brake protein YcgR
MTQLERRLDERYRYTERATLLLPDGAEIDVRTRDLSLTGLAVECRELVQRGTQGMLKLSLKLPGSAHAFSTPTIVRYAALLPILRYRMGLEFVDPPQAHLSALRRMMELLRER